MQQYLQLGLAKQRVANLLMRVREWQARWRQGEAPRPANVQPPPEPATQPLPIALDERATADKARPSGGEQQSGQNGHDGAEAAAQPRLATVPHCVAPRPASVRGVPHSSASPCANEPQVETEAAGFSSDSGQARELEKREPEGQNGKRLPEPLAGAA